MALVHDVTLDKSAVDDVPGALHKLASTRSNLQRTNLICVFLNDALVMLFTVFCRSCLPNGFQLGLRLYYRVDSH
jgi:hypothetical protein